MTERADAGGFYCHTIGLFLADVGMLQPCGNWFVVLMEQT